MSICLCVGWSIGLSRFLKKSGKLHFHRSYRSTFFKFWRPQLPIQIFLQSAELCAAVWFDRGWAVDRAAGGSPIHRGGQPRPCTGRGSGPAPMLILCNSVGPTCMFELLCPRISEYE